jgi:hypothetical protein
MVSLAGRGAVVQDDCAIRSNSCVFKLYAILENRNCMIEEKQLFLQNF